MSYDAFSLTAPARVKALVVPIGPVKQSRFATFLRRLQRENVVRLGDVSPDGRPNRTLFSPLAFPDGLILFDISRNLPSSSQLDLVPFEIYRSTLLVIGILDWKEREYDQSQSERAEQVPSSEVLSHSLEALREAYPSIWAHRVLAFDCDETMRDLPSDIALIPPRSRAKTTTMKTIMCDMAAALLGEMSLYGRSVQEQPTVETPKAVLPPATNGVMSPLPPHMAQHSRPVSMAVRSGGSSPGLDERINHRFSMPVHTTSNHDSRSPTPGARTLSPVKGAATPPNTNMSEEMSASPSTSPRKLSLERHVKSPDHLTTSSQGVSGDLERTRGKARVGVVLGSLYLLAGRWPDAVRELSKSVLAARSSSDYVWQAKAMDHLIVCLIVSAWAGMDFKIPDVFRPASEVTSGSTNKSSKHSPSNSQYDISVSKSADPDKVLATLEAFAKLLPNLTYNILNLYGRAYTFTDDKLPSPSFETSVIRFAKLMTALNVSQDRIDQDCLSFLASGTELSGKEIAAGHSASLRKPEIVQVLLRAYPGTSPDSRLPAADRLAIMAGIMSALSDLGQYRKMAVLIREILSTMLPSLVQARKDEAAEMGIHPAASLAALNKSINQPKVENGTKTPDDTEHGMRSFLAMACQTLGISQGFRLQGEANPQAATPTLEVHPALQKAYGAQELKIDLLWACISTSEALPDLVGALHFSALLLRIVSSGVAPAPESYNGAPDLPIEAQERLANNINRTVSAAERLGLDSLDADYWDDFLVRSVELVSASQLHPLTAHRKSELNVAMEEQKGKDPFIHNPFLKPTAPAKQDILVAGEQATFRVMLQNLFEFDLDIERINLVSRDATVECPPHAVVVGPYRTQTMLLHAMPHEPGKLVFDGCKVKVRGCRERFFSIFESPWALKVDEKGKELRVHQSKATEQSASTSDQSKPSPSQAGCPVKSLLSLTVIPCQPIISLHSISVPQSALMLLEGEHKRCNVTLRNTSSTTPADLVLLSFTDSISADAQSSLANQELSPSDLHEIELMMAHRPILRIRSPEQFESLKLMPLNEVELEIEVFGRLGLTQGIIQLDYGFLGTPRSEAKDQFYTRKMTIPLAITVIPMLSLVDFGIVPIRNSILGAGHQPVLGINDHTLQSTAQDVNATEGSATTREHGSMCLMLLDFRNEWASTLTLKLLITHATHSEDQDHSPTQINLQPGSMARVPLPIPRIYIPAAESQLPIPSFNPDKKRQFIVPSAPTSVSAEREARETFWFREAILKQISATWEDSRSGHHGTVDLRRGVRLSQQMVNLYKLDDVVLQMSVSVAGDEDRSLAFRTTHGGTTPGSQVFKVPVREYLSLKTKLRNRSPTPFRLLLRLQPTLANQTGEAALDLHRKLLVDGVTQSPLPGLGAGEEQEVETGFLVLSRGIYEWQACVEELVKPTGNAGKASDGEQANRRPRARTGEMDLDVRDDRRRIWFAEEKCVVVAGDRD